LHSELGLIRDDAQTKKKLKLKNVVHSEELLGLSLLVDTRIVGWVELEL